MTWADASARRLARHFLTDRDRATDAAAVSAAVLGIHAQVMSAAELSAGIRADGLHRTMIRDALWPGRSLIKSRGPRGTVHLLAAADLPMWIGALSAVPTGPSPFPPEVRMTAAQTDKVVAAIADAVDGAELTVDELTTAIVKRTGSWAGAKVMPAFQEQWPRWRQAEALAMHRGALCFGPDRARRVTYTSPPDFVPVATDTALFELVSRYLRAYGPATAGQFARWSGAPPGWAGELFERFADRLEPVDFDGVAAWVTRGDTEIPEPGYAGLRLLPYFDAYVVGCFPRARLFPGRAAERALNRGQAGNVPVLLVDGVVAGVWQQRRSSRRTVVTVEPFVPVTASLRRSLDAEVGRLGAVLQARAELQVGTVSVGPHA